KVFGVYKLVNWRVNTVPGMFPENARAIQQFLEDPLETLVLLMPRLPVFEPTSKLTQEHIDDLQMSQKTLLECCVQQLSNAAFPVLTRCILPTEAIGGIFQEHYFSPYIIPTIPHVLWMD
ncbi:hypothetical protein FKP32DRAFT_1561994, partial [Trametes sanguinea]